MRLAQISDLHLGAEDPAVLAGLRADLPAQEVRGTEAALRTAAYAGVDLILCGHDHVQASADLAAGRPGLRRHVLGVMAGTSVSRRVRAGEPQSYNVFDFDGRDGLSLTVRQWHDGRFTDGPRHRWSRSPDGWHAT